MSDPSLLKLGGKTEDGRPFFEPHHLAAAEQLEKLFRRAQLSPRLTMSYGGQVSGGSRGANRASELSQIGADARQKLGALIAALPEDCGGALLDVCCFGKGIQQLEIERRWPRRSAKLVLRIGLDQLARHWGLAPHRAGLQGGAVSGWLERRLPLIATRPLNQADGVNDG